jgi:AbrB family looped-hinge helix DNA binding protein
MRVSTKGQVTIPLAIRERLGLDPGTEVEFELDGNAVRLRRVDGLSRGAAIVAHLRERGTKARTTGMTTDEIMALTRGE